MPLKIFRPITPTLRFTELNRPEEIIDKRPERGLTEHKHKTGGRNCYGRLTSRRRGGGHKQLYRIIDFKRAKLDTPRRGAGDRIRSQPHRAHRPRRLWRRHQKLHSRAQGPQGRRHA